MRREYEQLYKDLFFKYGWLLGTKDWNILYAWLYERKSMEKIAREYNVSSGRIHQRLSRCERKFDIAVVMGYEKRMESLRGYAPTYQELNIQGELKQYLDIAYGLMKVCRRRRTYDRKNRDNT